MTLFAVVLRVAILVEALGTFQYHILPVYPERIEALLAPGRVGHVFHPAFRANLISHNAFKMKRSSKEI